MTALRYHNVYGPRMPKDTPYAGVASIFRSAIERGERPRVFEDGAQTRDFVHVSDVARANVAALTTDAPVVGTAERGLGRGLAPSLTWPGPAVPARGWNRSWWAAVVSATSATSSPARHGRPSAWGSGRSSPSTSAPFRLTAGADKRRLYTSYLPLLALRRRAARATAAPDGAASRPAVGAP